jgi:hypothetical protein
MSEPNPDSTERKTDRIEAFSDGKPRALRCRRSSYARTRELAWFSRRERSLTRLDVEVIVTEGTPPMSLQDSFFLPCRSERAVRGRVCSSF